VSPPSELELAPHGLNDPGRSTGAGEPGQLPGEFDGPNPLPAGGAGSRGATGAGTGAGLCTGAPGEGSAPGARPRIGGGMIVCMDSSAAAARGGDPAGGRGFTGAGAGGVTGRPICGGGGGAATGGRALGVRGGSAGSFGAALGSGNPIVFSSWSSPGTPMNTLPIHPSCLHVADHLRRHVRRRPPSRTVCLSGGRLGRVALLDLLVGRRCVVLGRVRSRAWPPRARLHLHHSRPIGIGRDPPKIGRKDWDGE
jgi:hypothetical protein